MAAQTLTPTTPAIALATLAVLRRILERTPTANPRQTPPRVLGAWRAVEYVSQVADGIDEEALEVHIRWAVNKVNGAVNLEAGPRGATSQNTVSAPEEDEKKVGEEEEMALSDSEDGGIVLTGESPAADNSDAASVSTNPYDRPSKASQLCATSAEFVPGATLPEGAVKPRAVLRAEWPCDFCGLECFCEGLGD